MTLRKVQAEEQIHGLLLKAVSCSSSLAAASPLDVNLSRTQASTNCCTPNDWDNTTTMAGCGHSAFVHMNIFTFVCFTWHPHNTEAVSRRHGLPESVRIPIRLYSWYDDKPCLCDLKLLIEKKKKKKEMNE